MKLTWMKWSALAASVLVTGSVAMGQSQPPPTPPTEWTPTTTPIQAARPKPTPERPKNNQPKRIVQRVKSGQSAGGQSAHLGTKEAAINGKTKADGAANGGKPTVAGKKPKEQNTASKNAKTQPEAKPQQ